MEIILFLKWSYRKKPLTSWKYWWFAKLITLPLGLNLYTRKISLHRRAVVHSLRLFFFRPIIFTRLVCPDISASRLLTALFKDACVQIVKNGMKPVHEGRIKNFNTGSIIFHRVQVSTSAFYLSRLDALIFGGVLYRLKRKSTKNFRSKLRRRFQRPSTSRKIQGHIKSERFYYYHRVHLCRLPSCCVTSSVQWLCSQGLARFYLFGKTKIFVNKCLGYKLNWRV